MDVRYERKVSTTGSGFNFDVAKLYSLNVYSLLQRSAGKAACTLFSAPAEPPQSL